MSCAKLDIQITLRCAQRFWKFIFLYASAAEILQSIIIKFMPATQNQRHCNASRPYATQNVEASTCAAPGWTHVPEELPPKVKERTWIERIR